MDVCQTKLDPDSKGSMARVQFCVMEVFKMKTAPGRGRPSHRG